MIERRDFGRTGHQSTRVIFGGAGLAAMRQEKADQVLDVLLEFGVNHIDTAASYGDSELRIAPWLAGHPDRFFIATKTGERTGAGARASLERSLDRLGVDRVDLIQLHNLVEPDEWQTAFAPGGAVDAMAQAREEGMCRFIGVTGHGLRIAARHLESLQRFPFDSVLLPYNHVLVRERPDYRDDFERLLAVCEERGVAVQTIKSVARRRWPERPERRFSWYEPIEDEEALARAVRFVLADDGVFLNTSSDTRLLRPTLEAASAPRPRPTDEELTADAERLAMAPLFDGAELERI